MEKKEILKKKSLGQHFLHNAHYLEAVVNAAQIKKGMRVLEVGPGDGALTSKLLASSSEVIAIEKDHRLIPLLQEKFQKEIASGQLKLIEGDALDFEPSSYKLKARSYAVVGNIPYYITGALIKKYLTAPKQPSTLVFLIQKEVAERITNHGVASKNPKESILSLSVKAYGSPKYVTTVPRGAFVPPPKVDSAILAVSGISRKHFTKKGQEERFFALIKAGFSQKRKLLKRNVERVLGKKTTDAFVKAGIAEHARAEDISLEKWLALCSFRQS